MPTNEEKHKVARSLRGYHGNRNNQYRATDFLCYIAKEIGFGDKDGSFVDPSLHYFANSLADYIEPEPQRTCHPVMMDWLGNPPYYKGSMSLDTITVGCSECGFPWKESTSRLPNYCWHCGAKVIT